MSPLQSPGPTAVREHDAEAWSLDVDFPRVRDIFRRAAYGEAGVVELLGGRLSTMPTAAELPGMLHHTAGGTPLATLVRLFLLGVWVDERAARQALDPMDPAR